MGRRKGCFIQSHAENGLNFLLRDCSFFLQKAYLKIFLFRVKIKNGKITGVVGAVWG